jgi:hypothetical protein
VRASSERRARGRDCDDSNRGVSGRCRDLRRHRRQLRRSRRRRRPDSSCSDLVRRRRRDGYGDDTDTATSCVAPDGYVAAGGDCDDADAFTFPEAYELCDGIDNDCNAAADDDIDYVDWYADADGDGTAMRPTR